ncbi:MAG: type III pantothenate kinase [Bacteroidales bacterium]|jgi:type III pantothenate kinase|nr:type III pantothenate kinase [Bacteroidales bacterium]
MRNLVIDIGNTCSKIALFDDGRCTWKADTAALDVDDISRVANGEPHTEHAILGTSGDCPAQLAAVLCGRFSDMIFLNGRTPLPIRNCYQTPETLGSDRLATAVGAVALYPRQNLMVIDAGTAITADIITATGDYLGGAISPGLQMRFTALNRFTSRLPLLSPSDRPLPEVGRTTDEAIQLGVQRGVVAETEYAIAMSEKIHDNLMVIITGGDARFLAKRLKKQVFIIQELGLIGLDHILRYNLSKKTG